MPVAPAASFSLDSVWCSVFVGVIRPPPPPHGALGYTTRGLTRLKATAALSRLACLPELPLHLPRPGPAIRPPLSRATFARLGTLALRHRKRFRTPRPLPLPFPPLGRTHMRPATIPVVTLPRWPLMSQGVATFKTARTRTSSTTIRRNCRVRPRLSVDMGPSAPSVSLVTDLLARIRRW